MRGLRLTALGLAFALAAPAGAQSFPCAAAPSPLPGAGIDADAALAGGDTLRLTVAVLYTPEAADSALALSRPISEWIADAFVAWQVVLDSAATPGPRVEAVALGPLVLDLAETGDCFADLDAFRAHPRAGTVRDSLLANVVVLFTARCSAGYQCTDTSDCEASAYATARFPVAGAPTPQGGHALAHEVGHLLGMRHDAGDDPTPGPNHGLRDDAGGFFTVMATRGALPRTGLVSYYSDPRRAVGGRPLGVTGLADNASVLRLNAPVAVTWNQGVPVEPGPAALPLSLTAAPNPARASWFVRVGAPAVGRVLLDLVDATGRVVWTVGRTVDGRADMRVPTDGLAPGVYLLRAVWTGGTGERVGRLALVRTR